LGVSGDEGLGKDGWKARGEQELNWLGYDLLKRERMADAMEICKLNVEMFPNAFNPYDSLGEAYLKAGNRALAAKNYWKLLELIPYNTNARTVLRQIQ
jgi:hypothetical protein